MIENSEIFQPTEFDEPTFARQEKPVVLINITATANTIKINRILILITRQTKN